MIKDLFQPDDLKLAIEFVQPAVVAFEGGEYSFLCPHCRKNHTMVCMATPGQPMVLLGATGATVRGGFATAGLDSRSGSMLATPAMTAEKAQVVAAFACPNADGKALAAELDKRGDVLDGYRQILRAVLDHYQPSKVIALGRHCYELVTGRSVPDTSLYGAYTFLGDIPVHGLPAPKMEAQAPFRKKRFVAALERALTVIPPRIATGGIKLDVVESTEESQQACDRLRAGRFLYFDVEFAGNPYGEGFRLLCLAARCPDHDTVYLWEESQLNDRSIVAPLLDVLADPKVRKGAHNAKAEWLACSQFFPELRHASTGRTKIKNLYADSMLLVYLLGLGGQVRLSTCAEYVGLGGQKDQVGHAVAGVGQLVRFLRKEVRDGSTIEAGLDRYRGRLLNKLSAEYKKALVDFFKATGYPLKVSRLLANELLEKTSRGAETQLSSAWNKLTLDHGNPQSSELLLAAVRDAISEPERYTYGLIDQGVLGVYCAKDVFTGSEVAVWAGKQVVNTPGLRETWFETVGPATEVISQMERNGIPTDDDRLAEVVRMARSDMAVCAEKLRELGFEGELKNADIARFLFEKLGFEPVVYTEKGAVSVSEEALEALIEQAPESPVMTILKEYSAASKINAAFGDKLRQKIAVDGCIHATFKTDGTDTGRLSAVDPNLQQLPSRSIYAKYVKGAFVGRINGRQGVLIQLDFSQIELRAAAALSGDPNMIAAFVSGVDFHRATASIVWSLSPDDVTKDQRSAAKEVNFGFLFNKSIPSMAKTLGKTVEATRAIKEQINGKYQVLDAKLRSWEKFAETNGYCRTYWFDEAKKEWTPRRVRHLHDIKHVLGGFASTAKNGSVNTPIQGTSGDITLRSLVEIDRWIEETGVGAKIVLTVHDSICIIASFEDTLRVAVKCKQIMESWNIAGVPIVADCELGLDYGHAYPLKDVVAGAAMLARGFPEDEAALTANILRDSRDFAILENLAPFVEGYTQETA